MVYGTIKPGASLHPLRVAGFDSLRHVGPAYETLVSFDYQPGKDHRIDFKVVPWLAEGWTQPDDATYVFRIRRGVKWHDSQEFTAADVIRTFQWVRDEKFNPATTVRQISTMEAPDPYTLKLGLQKPDATFLEALADPNLLITPKHGIDGGVDFAKTVIGTGPFKLQAFESGKESVWTRHAEYWQSGRPYPDAIRQFWGADDAIMTAAFVAGKNDLLAVPDRAQLEAVLRQKPEAQHKFEVQDFGLVFYPQVDRPPFSDARVRRAMHLALDRQVLIKQITFGDGSINPPLLPGWRTGWTIPQEELVGLAGYRQPKDQDLAEAKRLLAETGYPDGLKFKLMYNSQGVAPPRVAVAVDPQWRAVGLNAELEPLESGVARKREEERQFEVTIIATLRANFSNLEARYHSMGSLNRNGISDNGLDELISRFRSALKQADRQRLSLDLQRYLLEHLYTIPTIDIGSAGMWQPWVKDYVLTNAAGVGPYQPAVSRWWLDQKLVPKDR